jgi:hypothetical protein
MLFLVAVGIIGVILYILYLAVCVMAIPFIALGQVIISSVKHDT